MICLDNVPIQFLRMGRIQMISIVVFKVRKPKVTSGFASGILNISVGLCILMQSFQHQIYIYSNIQDWFISCKLPGFVAMFYFNIFKRCMSCFLFEILAGWKSVLFQKLFFKYWVESTKFIQHELLLRARTDDLIETSTNRIYKDCKTNPKLHDLFSQSVLCNRNEFKKKHF